MIKLIASDMDGTLLDAHMSISTENTEAIRMANEAGYRIYGSYWTQRTRSTSSLR